MQPAYLLTSIIFVYYFTVFRYFGLQVARLKMRGTQIFGVHTEYFMALVQDSLS